MKRSTRLYIIALAWLALGAYEGLAKGDSTGMMLCYIASFLCEDRAERAEGKS